MSATLYILGAGCSVCGGYPLANQVTERLQEFAHTRLSDDNSENLRMCFLETCARMQRLGVKTIDQLAEALNGREPDALHDAKLAISAYFLSLEDHAVTLAAKNYANFFQEIFRFGDSPLIEDRVKATRCRVITYNYDRLFERSFVEWVRQVEPDNQDLADGVDSFISRYLNTGLGDPHQMRWTDKQFCLLKIHGGIGQWNRTGDYGFKHIYKPKLGSRIPEICDANYFESRASASDWPTLIFPADKHRELECKTDGSFFEYIHGVEMRSLALMEEAEEIQVLGYSIQPIDYTSFKALIGESMKCERIVIRNRVCERDRLVNILEKLREEVSGAWEIDFKAEDFFGEEL